VGMRVTPEFEEERLGRLSDIKWFKPAG